jgi:hypothetical protein
MQNTLDQLRSRLLQVGATKLSWSLERSAEDHTRWICSVQAANEMGAPVELSPDVADELRQIFQSRLLGPLRAGVWLMDVQTGDISGPEPRPGEGASAPGIAERTP